MRTLKFQYFFTFILILCTLAVYSQEREKIIKDLRKDLEHLASDRMKGREAGTKHARDAAEYIEKKFEDLGLTTLYKEGYFQTFEFPDKKNPHDDNEEGEMLKGQNVVGFIDNGANTSVIIGAHYDHLGMGGSGSLSDAKDEVHNGADDNASGVIGLFYIAERLKNSPYKKNNYIFIAFTGEEKGLYGSNYFLKHPPFYLNKMNYMINLDMIGRLDSTKGVIVNGVGTSPIWKSTLEKGHDKLDFKTTESGVGPSDHTSFYLKDIPAIHFFTGAHEDYHKPSDDADKINYEGILTICDFIVDVIIKEYNSKLKLAFTRTKDDDQGVPDFKVTLGVIPDYLFDGKGMRIEGVKEDRPASKAGIQSGDVVIGIGEIVVTDMKSYMFGLSKLEEGTKSKVRVLREEKELEFDVQF